MGAIRTSLILNDGMTTALRRINNAMKLMINNFEAVQRASGESMNTEDIIAAKREIELANKALDEMEGEYRTLNGQQTELNESIGDGTKNAGGLLNTLKGVATAYLGMKGVSWLKESLSLYDIQNSAETQLKTVLQNVGAGADALETLKEKASSLQAVTSYGDEVLLGGAAEFATYMSDTEAIALMMDTLTNYAAGMSGGGEIDYTSMVDYATGLGKIMTGSYDAMTKKGFEFTEAQKKVIENGTDMEKALTISEVINESWSELAVSMANTPEGKIIQLKNSFGDMREELAARVYPTIMTLFDSLGAGSDVMKDMLLGIAKPINVIVSLLTRVVNAAFGVYSFFKDNWGTIGPIIWGIVAAFAAYNAALVINNTIQTISGALKTVAAIAAVAHGTATAAEAAATTKMTAAQIKFNAALLSCPLTWILVAIIAIIVLIFAIVGAINKLCGTSISAVGVIVGALSAAGAFVWNLILGVFDVVLGVLNNVINPFIDIANFIGNVFTNPVSSIIYLFQGLADNVLGIIQKIASALDFVFGSNMADSVQGWRDSLKIKADEMVAEYAPNESYSEVVGKLNLSVDDLGLKRIAYSDAYSAGYSVGEGLESSLGDMLDTEKLLADQSALLTDISDDTGDISDSIDKTTEELAYLRDIAEQEAINRFTTAELRVDFTSNNNINSNMDIDGVVSVFTEQVVQALETAAEGVY